VEGDGKARGLVIAGTHSGCGKTSVALGLMAALAQSGLSVAPFKVGPDFIDPGHHEEVTGAISHNLDGWMMDRASNLGIFFRDAEGVDVAVVEGVMGLFDGYDGRTEAGSTAEMAKWLGLPVLLVVDARSMARSVGAVVLGFSRFDPDLRITGVVFNRVASPGHARYLRQAMEAVPEVPVLGTLPLDPGLTMPQRHLGLVTRHEHRLDASSKKRLASWLEANIDVRTLAAKLPPMDTSLRPDMGAQPDIGQQDPVAIGVARDEALCFYYGQNLRLLEAHGARLVFFSPLRDRHLPQGLSGLYLGGGYPEVFAQELARNRSVLEELGAVCRQGMPVVAECGGFMILCRSLSDMGGRRHGMAGVFGLDCRMHRHRVALGYREVALVRETVLGPAGQVLRGHEFHYSSVSRDDAPGLENAYAATGRTGKAATCPGYVVNRCVGSYLHLHFGSNPTAAASFVAACREFSRAGGA